MSNPSFDRHLDDQIEERFGPEPIPQEECRHCDDLTEPDRVDPSEGLCGDCLLPYGHTDAEAIEHLQNQISGLEMKVKNQAVRIAELKAEITGYRTMCPPKIAVCAVCGEKPSLQKSLACEDCVEGGPR